MSRPLRGQTLGIAGLGRIGRAVAVRALAFGMKVKAYDPIWKPERRADGIDVRPSFDELLAESDYLTLHLPLLDRTRHLMNREAFARMKPGAVLVNTSRGGLVSEPDLINALRSGRLGGALLDVLEREPPPADHPLFQFENVLITPHAAGVDTQSLGDMARSAAESIAAIQNGDWPIEKIANPEVRERRKCGVYR